MSNNNEKQATANHERRQFLKGLGAIAIAGGSGFAVTTSANAAMVRYSEKQTGVGYRETPHIRDYYDSL